MNHRLLLPRCFIIIYYGRGGDILFWRTYMPLFKKCEEYVYIRELVDKGIYPYFHELESKQDIAVSYTHLTLPTN